MGWRCIASTEGGCFEHGAWGLALTIQIDTYNNGE